MAILKRGRDWSAAGLVGVLAIGIGLAGLVWRWYSVRVTAARTMECTGNMNQIKLAIAMYHDIYGELPPVVVRDSDGNAMHSWRALIYSCINEEFREKYNMSESWDGPHNRSLLLQMPQMFACPFHRDKSAVGQTTYVAVKWRDRFLREGRGQSLKAFSEVIPPVVLLVESHSGAVPWLEPVDITYDPYQKSAAQVHVTSGGDQGGAIVLLSDMTTPRLGPKSSIPRDWLLEEK